jgi:hypothetical protein
VVAPIVIRVVRGFPQVAHLSAIWLWAAVRSRALLAQPFVARVLVADVDVHVAQLLKNILTLSRFAALTDFAAFIVNLEAIFAKHFAKDVRARCGALARLTAVLVEFVAIFTEDLLHTK